MSREEKLQAVSLKPFQNKVRRLLPRRQGEKTSTKKTRREDFYQEDKVRRLLPRRQVEKLGKAFADVPKFVLRQGSKSQNRTHPSPLPPHGGIRVSFLPSSRGANVGRSFVLPLPSHRGLKLESAD
ncbi:hypothetical protein AVEN_22281-1 [Araneus ventricosus]|uniref:Uncharacterized protein n=1 Tax=Araneus ventricosus TaxID=182803 RepID=A0A4Y2HTZ7_ARAVE|nr:hypothetical protein AVEN_22281-1 [Araneus ventricosus]